VERAKRIDLGTFDFDGEGDRSDESNVAPGTLARLLGRYSTQVRRERSRQHGRMRRAESVWPNVVLRLVALDHACYGEARVLAGGDFFTV
jgi:hypothetical protein